MNPNLKRRLCVDIWKKDVQSKVGTRNTDWVMGLSVNRCGQSAKNAKQTQNEKKPKISMRKTAGCAENWRKGKRKTHS